MNSRLTPPIPPPPPRQPFGLGRLVNLHPAGRRWPIAVRAAICMGVPVAVGCTVGDAPAGLLATLGAFTSLYGTDRPYLNRSILLAAVALSFTIVVSLGISARQLGAISIFVVVLTAVISTYLCNAFRVGPPGAYMFVLACAVGTALPSAHLDIWQIALLVLAGGAFSWFVQMSGMPFQSRGPETMAVSSAATAVACFAAAVSTQQEDTARHAAALALHDAWRALVTLQPALGRPDGELSRLRALNRDLHLLFVEAINNGHQSSGVAERASRVGAELASPGQSGDFADHRHIPLVERGSANPLSKA
jgi:hypothetical protein